MRLLFVYSPSSAFHIDEPLGILDLSAILKANGHQCELIIPDFEKDFLSKIKEFKPDVIGYSCIAGSEDYYLNINRFLKSRLDFISIMGGPHPTFSPDVIEEKSLDIICRGEGDYPLLELANKFDAKEDISNILNLWVKRGGNIIKNNVRPRIRDLDNLPMPDRAVLYKYDCYSKYQSRTFMASRGCPYRCSYCFNHAYNKMYGEKKVVEHKSVSRLLSEIEAVRKDYGIKRITFQDDVFGANTAWLKEFARRYPESVGLPFSIFARAEMITEDAAMYLSSAGCKTVIMAIESGVERIRHEVLKKNMSNRRIIQAAGFLHKYNISIVTQNMIGLPTEQYDDILETIKLNIECKPDYAWVSIFQPYPGTEIYEYCKENGLLSGNYKNVPNFHYSSMPNSGDSKKVEKIHKVFALAISFPFLLKWIGFLLKISPLGLLKVIYVLFKGYAYAFRQKVTLIDRGLLSYIGKMFMGKGFTKFLPANFR